MDHFLRTLPHRPPLNWFTFRPPLFCPLLPPRRPLRVGSTSVLSDEDGLKVGGSEVVYAPFGEIREGDLSDLTDFASLHFGPPQV